MPEAGRAEPGCGPRRDAASRLLPSLLPDPTPQTGGSFPSPQRLAGALQGEAEVRGEAAPRRTTPAAEPPALPGPAPPGSGRPPAPPPRPRGGRAAPAPPALPRSPRGGDPAPSIPAGCSEVRGGVGRGRRGGEPGPLPPAAPRREEETAAKEEDPRAEQTHQVRDKAGTGAAAPGWIRVAALPPPPPPKHIKRLE